MKHITSILTSLRLTIILLALSTALVFFGTLAQANFGLYDAQVKFFKSAFVSWNDLIPMLASILGDVLVGVFKLEPTFKASFSNAFVLGINIPIFPGGYLLGWLLVINLVAAQAKRTELTKKKAGLIMIHVGIVLMLVGQLATDKLSTESQMQLFEGDTKNFSEDFRANELAIIDTSDPKEDQVVAVPESILATRKDISNPALPFSIRVKEYWANADLLRSAFSNAVPANATEGFLKNAFVLSKPTAKVMDSRSLPAALIELTDKAGKSLGSWLVAAGIRSDDVAKVDGKDYRLSLRFTRHYKDFELSLLKATHEKYRGTDIPKNFASRVRVKMNSSPEVRETIIYMNNPLRWAGYTFFQYQMAADELALRQMNMDRASSTFQVVKNPSWVTPYIACVLVGVGLCWQFGFHLFGFLRRRKPSVA